MQKHYVRVEYDPTGDKIQLCSTVGDPWVDLEVLIQGIALSMAINRKRRKLDYKSLLEYVKKSIDDISNTRENWTVKDRTKPPAFLTLR